MTALVVVTDVHLCDCGRIVHADRWAGLSVDGRVVCHLCSPAAWVDR